MHRFPRALLGSLAPLVLLECVVASASPMPCEGDVHIEPTQGEGFVDLEAVNACQLPVVVHLRFPELENLLPSRETPLEVLVPPRGTVELLRLRRRNPQLRIHYVSDIQVVVQPVHDESARYGFPFGGDVPRRLVQGIEGGPTHRAEHRYAFDFDLPLGTPVLAARPGTVLRVKDGFPPGGFDESYRERANRVELLHDDGTLANYGHLRHGIEVRKGQRLEKGELLGYSGNSGFSQGPHLHFHVSKPRAEGGEETLPVVFEGDVVPRRGGWYGPAGQPGGFEPL